MELHPATVHFPIALLFTAGICLILVFILKKSFFLDMAFWLHTFGLIGVGLAIITGNLATPLEIPDEAKAMLNNHETLGYVIGWLYLMLWLWLYLRKTTMGKTEMTIFTILFIGCLALVTWTSWIGGQLVYEWGAGVK